MQWCASGRLFLSFCDICGAWSTFGGIAAQFNHLSIVLHLATVENTASALPYDSILSTHLGDLARARSEKSSETVDYAQLLSVEQTRFKLQAASHAPNPNQPAKVNDVKDKPKGEPSVPPGPPCSILRRRSHWGRSHARQRFPTNDQSMRRCRR